MKHSPAEREAVTKLYHGFGIRVLRALKPGARLWQKKYHLRLFPDPIALIRWLTKEAKAKEKKR